MQKPLIFIPTYNEAATIRPLARGILGLGLDLDLLFIDDGSPDGTGRMLDEMAAHVDRITVIHRPARAGIGSAHMAAVKYAREKGYGRLITMDGDMTHSPGDIPRLLSEKSRFDVVIGSRFAGSRSRDMQPPRRRLASRLGHLATQWGLGLPYDASSAFRLYHLERIPPAVLAQVRTTGYAFFFESLFFLAACGLRIGEVPVTIFPRHAGVSKMTFTDVLQWARQLATLRVKMVLRGNKVTFL